MARLKCTSVVVQQNAYVLQFVARMRRMLSRRRRRSAARDGLGHPLLKLADLLVVLRPLRQQARRDAELGLLGERVVALGSPTSMKRFTVRQSARPRRSAPPGAAQNRTRSMVLAVASVASEHHVSHHSHSCGREKMGTCICMWLGRSCHRRIARGAEGHSRMLAPPTPLPPLWRGARRAPGRGWPASWGRPRGTGIGRGSGHRRRSRGSASGRPRRARWRRGPSAA